MRWVVLRAVVGGVLVTACTNDPGTRQPLTPTKALLVRGPVSVQVLVGPTMEPSIQLDGAVQWSLTPERLLVEASDDAPRPTIFVTMKDLRAVVTEDDATVTVNRLLGGRLALAARRGGRLVVSHLEADTLRIDASSDGQVDVGGRTRVLDARVDDVGVAHTRSLQTVVARIDAAGLSTVTLGAAELVRATVRRSSRLILEGPSRQRLIQCDDSSTVEPGDGAAGTQVPTAER